jgi:adenosylcobinamide-phosphate synthase
MVLQAVVLWAALILDRLTGDPPNAWHPVAWLGRWIGWWGRPDTYPPALQRAAGTVLTLITAFLFAFPFFLVESLAGSLVLLIAGPFLLKITLAWRCLEEHVMAVKNSLDSDVEGGRDEVRMLVSRETSALEREEVLSAAYESMTENLVDAIVSPLFFFTFFGLGGAAFYRAVNTMDAMLGYTDERIRIGWFPARLDDLLNFVPARLTGLLLLVYFAFLGRFRPAYNVLRRDAGKRAGFNGGIPMAVMAGGTGTAFRKPGCYVIGNGERSLDEAGGEILGAVRAVTLLSALVFSATLAFIAVLEL